MFRNRVALPVLAALFVAVLAGLAAWALILRPTQVQVATIEQNVPIQVFGLGTVEARVVSKIGFKVTGVLTELRVDHGDEVAKGTVLARLDAREQAARLGRSVANIEQAEANLKRALASVARAEANHVNASNISERRQSLARTENVSIEAAQTARAAMEIARAELQLAHSDVEVARAAVRDARAQGELEDVTLDLHTLTAPYDAMIIARQRELGSALGPGEPVFTLIDPRTVWVLAYVDESKAGGVRVGQPAEIVQRSRPGTRLSGHVARIQIESDRVNEERRIEVAFDRVPEEFNLGEQAEVYITTIRLPRALLVPEPAIDEYKGTRGMVWTVEEGRFERREVTFGHRTLDGRVELVSGLPEGAMVVIQRAAGLRVGGAAKPGGVR